MCHSVTNRVMPGLKEILFWLGTAVLIVGIMVSTYGLAVYVLAWSNVPNPESSPDPEGAVFGRSLQSLGVGVFLIGAVVTLFTKTKGSSASRLLTLAVAAVLPYVMVTFFWVRTRGIPSILLVVIIAMWASVWLLYVALTKAWARSQRAVNADAVSSRTIF